MDLRDNLKKTLRKRLGEQQGGGSHPGITTTKSVQKKEKKTNDDYYKDVEDKMKEYGTYDSGKEDSNEDYTLNEPPRYEPGDEEQEYIEDVERSMGPQHLEYDREPSDKFKERAKNAIEGDSTMGNETYTGDENGNTEPVWNASSEDFGEELTDQVKRRKKRSDDSKESITSLGDDIELSDKERATRAIAFGESKNKSNKAIKENKKSNTMKRLKFKKNFNGKDNALKLIPEHYKVDGNKFEITDGNETYKIRWEISETTSDGRPIILESKDNEVLKEEHSRAKELMGFKPQDKFGNLKGKQRVQERDKFYDIWDKSKKIIEEGNNDQSDEEKINSLNEIDGKLKKKHIPKLSKKALLEVANSIGNKRLKKYDVSYDDISEIVSLKDNISEGITYDKLNYILEEGVKEAARKSLIKEDIKPVNEQEGGHDPGEGAGAGAYEIYKNLMNMYEKISDPEERKKFAAKVKEFVQGLGSAASAGIKHEGEDDMSLNEAYSKLQEALNSEINEQHGGHDPSEGAGAGAEELFKKAKNMLKKADAEKAMSDVKKFFQDVAKGAGSATGTGTTGIKRESAKKKGSKKMISEREGGKQWYAVIGPVSDSKADTLASKFPNSSSVVDYSELDGGINFKDHPKLEPKESEDGGFEGPTGM